MEPYRANPERFVQDDDGQWWYLLGGGRRTRAFVKQCEYCGIDFLPTAHNQHKQRFHSKACAKRMTSGWTGRKLSPQGYVLLYRPEHPATRADGWIMEHRVVMEGVLGRELFPYEQVHHKNGVRDDNRPANLELWERAHPSGQRSGEGQHCPTCTCFTA